MEFKQRLKTKLLTMLRIDLRKNDLTKVALINIGHLFVLILIVWRASSDSQDAIRWASLWGISVGILMVTVLKNWQSLLQTVRDQEATKKYKEEIEYLEEYKLYVWPVIILYYVLLGLMIYTGKMSRFGGLGLAICYGIGGWLLSWKLILEFKGIYTYIKQILDAEEKEEPNVSFLSPIIDALEQVEINFNEAVQKEVASQRMKTELISNVSHDLKTPLTSIISYVDLLKDENLSKEEQRKYIDILDQKSQRLKVLIEDLVEASKAASGNIKLVTEEIDLVALLKQTLGEMSEKVGKSHLQFKVTLPEEKLICELDGRRTYRIFENLIGNIIKYAAAYSRVYIECKSEEEEAIITFKNISANEMNFTAEEIVERFKRGDESRHTEGSGLGLAIAKNLTELQGGSFEIYIDGDLFKVTIKFALKDNEDVDLEKYYKKRHKHMGKAMLLKQESLLEDEEDDDDELD